jgi:pimeloyl-ACP methyl ester carboxylesterase
VDGKKKKALEEKEKRSMIQEKIVVGAGSEFPLDGLLTLPEDASANNPVPALVLVHGSGASDKDSKVFAVRPFKDIAEGLAARGIATVRYDKRTFTYAKQMAKDAAMSMRKESIEDAIRALSLLRDDPRIDSDRIYLAGLSMGGMLAPRIDAEAKEATGQGFAGLISLAGSPRKLDDILTGQLEDMIPTMKPPMRWLVNWQLGSLKKAFTGMYELSDEEAQEKKIMMGAARLYYFVEAGRHPAESYLKNLDKPILFLQGEDDFQVLVCKDFDSYKEIMAGKDNASFKLYPGLNHTFMKSHYPQAKDAKKEYSISQHVDVQVIDDIATWIETGEIAGAVKEDLTN